MDVISAVADQLGLDEGKATAVVGALLGAARAQVPAAESSKLDAAIPELGSWVAAAAQLGAAPATPAPASSSVGGVFGDLLQAAGSGVGGELLGAIAGKEVQQTAAAAAILDGLGLETRHAAMVAPLVLEFLRHRLGAEWTDRIVQAAPLLAGPGGAGGVLQSLLGAATDRE